MHIYSRTDTFTLSGFTTAFKAALNERKSTGHRVAFHNHDGFNSPTGTENEKWFAFILRSTGAAVRALAPRERVSLFIVVIFFSFFLCCFFFFLSINYERRFE